jgi:predicted DNA-binding WGR domain protein
MLSFTAERTLLRYIDIDIDRSSDKFYVVYVIHRDGDEHNHRVLYNWGRSGTNGQWKLEVYANFADAEVAARRKIMDKRAKGYKVVIDAQNMPVVPYDILIHAGWSPNGRSEVELTEDPAREISLAAEGVIRMLTTGCEIPDAVIATKSLHDQLDALRIKVLQAEGQIEVVDMLLQSVVG